MTHRFWSIDYTPCIMEPLISYKLYDTADFVTLSVKQLESIANDLNLHTELSQRNDDRIQDIEDKIKNVRVSFFDIPSATDLGELARSVGQAMAIGADLLRRVIEAFFDISGLGFVKRLIEMGANFRGHKSLQKRRGFVHGNDDDFLLSAITFFRRSVWFMAFSSIYMVSPVLGAITVRTHSSF